MADRLEAPTLPFMVHEHFCQPTAGRDAIRVEQFIAYADAPSGRSEPAKRVTRCQECGVARYDNL